MDPQLIAVLSLGFVLGLKHATDADHVVAVTTFVTQERSLLRSSWIGAFWGLGHSLSLAAAGCVVIGLKVSITPMWEARLEMLVALMLIGLGARVIFQKNHTHSHPPGMHPHSHFGWTRFGLRPLLVGMVHGAAGSAALMLLVLSTIRRPMDAAAYIVVFGIGSMLGMLIVSALLAFPLRWVNARLTTGFRRIQIAAGLLSCLFGIYLSFRVIPNL